jgi:hypothetical protein
VDFRLYAQVLRRHWVLVVCGFFIALGLAELSVVHVGTNGTIRYRQTELWSSTTRLSLGNQFESPIPPGTPDPSILASQYAIFATSDPVRRLMLRDGPILGKVDANALVDSSGATQPFVDVIGTSKSSTAAYALSGRAARALQKYIRLNHGVPLRTILRDRAVVSRPRSKTMPILIFLAVMFAFVGLAFIFDNVRPRRSERDDRLSEAPAVEPQAAGVEAQSAQRRTA